MTDTRAVLCPYCGAEMTEAMSFESGLFTPGSDEYEGSLMCRQCRSVGPLVRGCRTEDEVEAKARIAALRRPLQKPLTWDEVLKAGKQDDSIVWIECRDENKGVLVNGHHSPAEKYEFDFVMNIARHTGEIVFYSPGYDKAIEPFGAYGEDWRCWATKPTDEEREAARWESE